MSRVNKRRGSLSKKKVPWKLIVSGTILMNFRLLVVSKLIVDSSQSQHFQKQHLEFYQYVNFGDLTPCNKNLINLM